MTRTTRGLVSLPNSSDKIFREGTERAVPPRETLARVRPLMSKLGITRIADVTGLDRIGVPVVAVIRPNSRSVSVAQGKGLTLDAAEASGLMESIESYHAEHARLPLLHGSARELAQLHPLADVTRLPLLATSTFHPDLPLLWTAAVDLASGASVLVPYEVVHTDFRVPLPAGSGAFLMSSNGLASGNNLPEALSHGICELVERDANTLFVMGGGTKQSSRHVDPTTVTDPACRSVLERFEAADCAVGIWETTSDVGIPSFLAILADHDAHSARPMPPMTGSGCHPRRHVALLRALTEAAQGRLTIIAGARDDLSGRGFDEHTAVRSTQDFTRFLAEVRAERSFSTAPDFDHSTFEGDVDFELRCLRAAGLQQVLSVNLSRPEYDVAVVRVIIPGLEAMSEVRGCVLGERGRRALALGAA